MTRRTAIAGLASVAATAAGCSRRDSRTRLQFWAVGREGEVAAQLIRGFMAQHPDIEVQVQQLPGTAAHEKILTAYAGDTLPDVCQLGNTWVPELFALKALTPLDEFIGQSSVVAPDDYFQGILDANRIGGTFYGVPWYVDTRLLFYRRDLLQQAGFDHPPRDWTEWTQMLAAIKSLVGPERYSVLLPLNEFEPLLVLALQQPAELLRDGRWGNFRSEDFRHAMSFYEEMFQRQWAPRMSNTQISNVWDEFSRGYFSFYISGPWQIGEFKRRVAPALQDAWMTAPMPGPTGPGASTAGGASLVIFEKSKNKRAAWQLIEYLSLPQTQRDFYQLIGDLPPRRSVWQSPVLAESIYAKAFHEQLARVRSPPKVPEWERIATQMRIMAERVVQKQTSLNAALAELDRQTDEILEKRRWMLERHAQV